MKIRKKYEFEIYFKFQLFNFSNIAIIVYFIYMPKKLKFFKIRLLEVCLFKIKQNFFVFIFLNYFQPLLLLLFSNDSTHIPQVKINIIEIIYLVFETLGEFGCIFIRLLLIHLKVCEINHFLPKIIFFEMY
uniref:Transmembrane protein n=1 Tax=Heterorhabditis bacteriophora TaxID=37862 RepID=A0A1I7WL39_HETBA